MVERRRMRESSQTDTLVSYEALLDELRRAIVIDKSELDYCVAMQPELYSKVAEHHARAIGLRDQAKHELAVAEAAASQSFRLAYLESKEKFTEGSIKEDVISDRKVQALRRGYNKWVETCEQWQALRDAYEERGRALRDLAHLFVAGYFQSSNVGKAMGDRSEARAEDNRRRLAQHRREKEYRDGTT